MTNPVDSPVSEPVNLHRVAAIEALQGAKKILSSEDAFQQPCKVSACLTTLKETIPNFLEWAGVADFEGRNFWESAQAREILGIVDPSPLPRLLLALEGLKLKFDADDLAQRAQALEDKRISLLKQAWNTEPGLGKGVQNAFRWGSPRLAREAVANLLQPPFP